MKKKKIKKRVTKKNSFPVFNLFKTTVFLLSALFLFFTISPTLAQVGLMNGIYSGCKPTTKAPPLITPIIFILIKQVK